MHQSENPKPVDYSQYGIFYHWSFRFLSFIAASVLSVLVLMMPQVIATSITELKHGLLSLCMWGMAGGFVHGVGYVPEMKIWRYSFGPYVAWPIMAYSFYLWLF